MEPLDLSGRCILVVEDEYLLADDLRNALIQAGAEVLGPVSDVAGALTLVEDGRSVDAAVLDINLRGDSVFPFADLLAQRGVPFVFATGYDRASVPARFADAPYLAKPLDKAGLAAVLGPIMAAPRA